MALARDGPSRSEPGLVQLVREAATALSDTGSASASWRSRSGRSGGLHSQRSGGSGLSRSRSCASGSASLREMQSRVEDQATERYKRELAKNAAAERSLLQSWETNVKSSIDGEKVEASIKKAREIQNENEVMQQIERNKDRRAQERREHIVNASSHAYPVLPATLINEEEVRAIRKKQRDQWREDLNRQVVTQEVLKNIEEARYRDQMQQQKARRLVSMRRERRLEQQRLRRQGQELVAAWDRDLQLRSLRRAMQVGVPPHTPGAPYA